MDIWRCFAEAAFFVPLSVLHFVDFRLGLDDVAIAREIG
jgi:hypothetical protein